MFNNMAAIPASTLATNGAKQRASNVMSCNAPKKDHSHDHDDPCVADGSLRLDLLSRLRQLCLGFGAQSGFPCRLCIKPEHALFDEPAAEVLYQAVRELMSVVR